MASTELILVKKTVKKAVSSARKTAKKVQKSARSSVRRIIRRTPKPVQKVVSRVHNSLKAVRKIVQKAKRNIVHSVQKKVQTIRKKRKEKERKEQSRNDMLAAKTVLLMPKKNIYYISKAKIKVPKSFKKIGISERKLVTIKATSVEKAMEMMVKAHKKYGGYCNYAISINGRAITSSEHRKLVSQMTAMPGVAERTAYSENSKKTIMMLMPVYSTYTEKKKKYVKKEAKKAARAALKGYGKADAYTKMIAINDYVCRHTTYDYDASSKEDSGAKDGAKLANESRTAYSFFKNHKTICVGYAQSYYEIAKAAGLKCRIISAGNRDRNKSGHAWNQVYVNGCWYNVDSTFNDTETEKFGDSHFASEKYINPVTKKKNVFDEDHKDYVDRASYGD